MAIQYSLILLLFYAITTLVVTLLKKGEEILSLNQVLKELEQSKRIGKTLFRITHEIKNPLSVCKGYLDMINYDDSIKLKKYIRIIKEEISRSLSIMDDFSDYTKIKIKTDIMDINMLLEDTVKSIKSLLVKKNIKFKLNIIADETIAEAIHDYYLHGSSMKNSSREIVNVIKNRLY